MVTINGVSAEQTEKTMDNAGPKSFHDFSVKTIDGEEVALSKYRSQVCLVVNVASR